MINPSGQPALVAVGEAFGELVGAAVAVPVGVAGLGLGAPGEGVALSYQVWSPARLRLISGVQEVKLVESAILASGRSSRTLSPSLLKIADGNVTVR